MTRSTSPTQVDGCLSLSGFCNLAFFKKKNIVVDMTFDP